MVIAVILGGYSGARLTPTTRGTEDGYLRNARGPYKYSTSTRCYPYSWPVLARQEIFARTRVFRRGCDICGAWCETSLLVFQKGLFQSRIYAGDVSYRGSELKTRYSFRRDSKLLDQGIYPQLPGCPGTNVESDVSISIGVSSVSDFLVTIFLFCFVFITYLTFQLETLSYP